MAGQLPRQPHNAPLHLFSASPELARFAGGAYSRRSDQTSRLLTQLFETLHAEGYAMAYTMEDFNRDFVKSHFPRLTPEEQEEVLRSLPPERRLAGLPPEKQEEVLQSLPPERRLAGLPLEERLAGLSAEQIRQYLDRLTAGRTGSTRRPKRKK